jgi:phosphate-selective porin OprO/OprP
MKKIVVLWLVGLMVMPMFAQEKLKVNPIGRMLVDAGCFDSKVEGLNNGMAIPDLRVGVKASYGEYQAKLDVGYANGKVRLKDAFVQKNMGESQFLMLGYFYPHFGMQAMLSSSKKVAMEAPPVDDLFVGSRRIGAMYVYGKSAFWGAFTFAVEEEAMKKKTNETDGQGYGLLARLLYRPYREEGRILHVGISGAYDTPKYNEDEALNHHSFVFEGGYPTQIADVQAVEAVVPDAKHMWRFTPEICAAYNKVAVEAQYYYTTVNRKNNLASYQASGAYVQLRGLLKGTAYAYDSTDSWIATPGQGSWECVLGYSYTDLNDDGCEIYGGRMNDASLTLNYYVNKYITWRLRYSYTHVEGRKGIASQSLNAIQTRFQIVF